MLGANGIEYLGQVVFQVSALRHEDRRYGDGAVSFVNERGNRVRQRRLHDVQERQFDRQAGALCLQRPLDLAERLSPLRVACAMREQDNGRAFCRARRHWRLFDELRPADDSYALPVLPNPAAPRSLSVKSSTMLS